MLLPKLPFLLAICVWYTEALLVRWELGGTWTIGSGESSILTLRIMFRGKINVNVYIEPRNEVNILKKRVFGISIFTKKLARPPIRRKKNILQYRVYCIQNDRLGHTVPTKQTVN